MSDQTQFKQSFGVGSVLANSVSQFFANFWLLLAIILVPTLGISLLNILVAQVTAGSFSNSDILQNDGPASIFAAYPPLFWFSLLISVLVGYVIWGAGILAVHGRITGLKISIAQCFRKAVLKFPPMFVLNLVLFLIIAVVVLPIALIFIFLGSIVGSFLGGILMMVAVAYVFACFMPLMPAILIENSGWSGLGRAAELTRGYRWPIVGLLALIILLVFITLFVFGLGIGAISMALLSTASTSTYTALAWVSAILNGIFTVLITGYSCTLVVVIYQKLLEIKEGHSGQDLEQVFQ